MSSVAAPVIYKLAMASDDTEYSLALPNGTKMIEVQSRTDDPVRFSFEAGNVASPTGTFMTIKSRGTYFTPQEIWGSATLTLYAAHTAGASVDLEILVWR